ncbi:hypothetical protein AA12717_3755 [Gluconacetobacter sacchari DSM 12717]|uniref:Uncharacterized protein n=2 Tax=Gluconacetobacter sacchari TaxID=92759 RepID=A0A7W4I9Z1_9PROT|nr:hypothetical protein [Gluconacetobacter sacchari]MBB2158991.1 hypothetical protein [Gluconacetobacter sacchari]GBQ31411.1 hypothetical protein AA12717_3755 [Gluconacetobacter sacchari DSM 12717]
MASKVTHARSYVPRSTLSVTGRRGDYNELIGADAYQVLSFLKPALPDEYAEFDKHRRGDALNLDLYGWDQDQSVGVVQVRQAFRIYKRQEFTNVRKTYVLCGFNESGTPFRHPVSAHAVRRACSGSPAETVAAAQRWMWGVTAKQLAESRRQGDILIVPERQADMRAALERKYPNLRIDHLTGLDATFLVSSHAVQAEEILIVRSPGGSVSRVLAKHPILRHSKGQHATVSAPRSGNHGWFSIRLADEAVAWDFSERFGD